MTDRPVTRCDMTHLLSRYRQGRWTEAHFHGPDKPELPIPVKGVNAQADAPGVFRSGRDRAWKSPNGFHIAPPGDQHHHRKYHATSGVRLA